ncbi:MAG TPA: RNA polymerase sigma factor [Polyangiaceae bacterium]|nr:RNA polymerase sigma factor [Polyangiaceae bacterium]
MSRALASSGVGEPVGASPSAVEGAPAKPDARSAEEGVFHLVYRQMHSLYGRHQRDFDDLVQAAAEQALRALPSFSGRSELSTWTYAICYRTLLRHRRTLRRFFARFSYEPPVREPSDPGTDACTALVREERARRLHAALDRLSTKRRAAVVLRDLEELEISEIAAITGANETTVRSRLRDGRRDLAALLARDPYFGEDACARGSRS